jgi:hypothetical protein
MAVCPTVLQAWPMETFGLQAGLDAAREVSGAINTAIAIMQSIFSPAARP